MHVKLGNRCDTIVKGSQTNFESLKRSLKYKDPKNTEQINALMRFEDTLLKNSKKRTNRKGKFLIWTGVWRR